MSAGITSSGVGSGGQCAKKRYWLTRLYYKQIECKLWRLGVFVYPPHITDCLRI